MSYPLHCLGRCKWSQVLCSRYPLARPLLSLHPHHTSYPPPFPDLHCLLHDLLVCECLHLSCSVSRVQRHQHWHLEDLVVGQPGSPAARGGGCTQQLLLNTCTQACLMSAMRMAANTHKECRWSCCLSTRQPLATCLPRPHPFRPPPQCPPHHLQDRSGIAWMMKSTSLSQNTSLSSNTSTTLFNRPMPCSSNSSSSMSSPASQAEALLCSLHKIQTCAGSCRARLCMPKKKGIT